MNYSIKVAEALKLDEEYKKILKYGAFLHDIGKIDMDREILTKPGKLTEFEMNIIKKHPVYGAAMVQPIKSLYGCIELILYHHENIDGSGYPEGIKGDEIPLGAKILRIVDSFDAMITDRPYKRGISVEDAKKELQKYAGVYYDKEIVEVFIELVEKEFKQFISRNYNIDY
jgi:putative nucleotidyltransferase with HDIG domain